MSVTKIATCCYCGARTALVLRGKDRHELSCGSCGAPLHYMKMLPKAAVRAAAPAATPARPKPSKRKKPEKRYTHDRPGKRRKSKGFGAKVWEEVWDALEDIFD